MKNRIKLSEYQLHDLIMESIFELDGAKQYVPPTNRTSDMTHFFTRDKETGHLRRKMPSDYCYDPSSTFNTEHSQEQLDKEFEEAMTNIRAGKTRFGETPRKLYESQLRRIIRETINEIKSYKEIANNSDFIPKTGNDKRKGKFFPKLKDKIARALNPRKASEFDRIIAKGDEMSKEGHKRYKRGLNALPGADDPYSAPKKKDIEDFDKGYKRYKKYQK